MSDPYQVLGLQKDAAGETVRQRYLELVRQFPPEREPQKFAELRAAYDALRDPIVSLEKRLFSVSAVHTFESLLAGLNQDEGDQRISTSVLLSLGKS